MKQHKYCYHPLHKIWINIKQNGKQKNIGRFDTAKEAALAYDNAVPDNRPKNFEQKRKK
jgi:hypothetical protein